MPESHVSITTDLPPTLRAELRGAVGVLTLARPEKRNALSDETILGIERYFQTLDPEGSFNYYRTADAGLTALLSTAASLPLNASEQAWKNVYARVADLAWFAPLVASNIVYLASDRVELPRPGLAVVIDLINVVPRK